MMSSSVKINERKIAKIGTELSCCWWWWWRWWCRDGLQVDCLQFVSDHIAFGPTVVWIQRFNPSDCLSHAHHCFRCSLLLNRGDSFCTGICASGVLVVSDFTLITERGLNWPWCWNVVALFTGRMRQVVRLNRGGKWQPDRKATAASTLPSSNYVYSTLRIYFSILDNINFVRLSMPFSASYKLI